MSLQLVVMVTEYHYQVVTFTSQFLQCRDVTMVIRPLLSYTLDLFIFFLVGTSTSGLMS